MQVIDGKTYYKVNEAALLAGVNTRTLRRWIAAGNLEHFLFPYRQTKTGPIYYRLEPPEDGDVKWEGEGVYIMPKKPEGGKRRKARPAAGTEEGEKTASKMKGVDGNGGGTGETQ